MIIGSIVFSVTALGTIVKYIVLPKYYEYKKEAEEYIEDKSQQIKLMNKFINNKIYIGEDTLIEGCQKDKEITSAVNSHESYILAIGASVITYLDREKNNIQEKNDKGEFEKIKYFSTYHMHYIIADLLLLTKKINKENEWSEILKILREKGEIPPSYKDVEEIKKFINKWQKEIEDLNNKLAEARKENTPWHLFKATIFELQKEL